MVSTPRSDGKASVEKPSLEGGTDVKRRSGPGKLWWAALLLAFVALAAFLGYQRITAPMIVETSVASVKPITGSFTAEAVVKGKQYELAAETGGRVIDLPLREGDRVEEGQILAVLDTQEADTAIVQAEAAYRASVAGVAQAAAQLELARREYNASIEAARSRVGQAEKAAARTRGGSRPEEIAQAEHRVERARAGLEEAEKAYRRSDYLYREGAISGAANDSAVARFKAATAEVAEAEDFLKMLRKGPREDDMAVADAAVQAAEADLRQATSRVGQLDVYRNALRSARASQAQAEAFMEQVGVRRAKQVLRAPAGGVLSRVRVELGMVAGAGQPVFTLNSREDLHIEAEVNTEDAPKVSKEMRVTVTSAAYPGRQFPATVKQVMPMGELKPDATIRTRIIRLRVMLDSDWTLFNPGWDPLESTCRHASLSIL